MVLLRGSFFRIKLKIHVCKFDSCDYKIQFYRKHFTQLKVTIHLCFKNSKNLQLLDVQACNSANEVAFQNPTKSLFAQWSIDVKGVVTF